MYESETEKVIEVNLAIGTMSNHWIAYTLSEGGNFLMLGFQHEHEADAVINLYKETGTMRNPHHYRTQDKDFYTPASMMKLTGTHSYYLVPKVVGGNL